VSLLQERFSQLIDAEVSRRLEAEAALRAERERQQRELLLLEKEQVQKIFYHIVVCIWHRCFLVNGVTVCIYVV
jgi:hypothetical protein